MNKRKRKRLTSQDASTASNAPPNRRTRSDLSVKANDRRHPLPFRPDRRPDDTKQVPRPPARPLPPSSKIERRGTRAIGGRRKAETLFWSRMSARVYKTKGNPMNIRTQACDRFFSLIPPAIRRAFRRPLPNYSSFRPPSARSLTRSIGRLNRATLILDEIRTPSAATW